MAKKNKDSKKRACIGIDIGGTKSLYALFDESFEILAEKKLRTHPEKGGVAAFTLEMERAVTSLMLEARKRGRDVRRVGVGCAGDIDLKRGVVRHSPNLEFLYGYKLRDRLVKLTGARVFVGHDVQAGLYGEFRLGAARKARHVIGAWIGTGVGGALIIDGRLHLGATGHAGDIGNYMLHAVDVAHESPRKEVLDNVASRTAIAGDAAALAAKHRAPQLRKAAGSDVNDIKAGDLADFLNPDMIVLGGGLIDAMPALMTKEITRAIRSHASAKASKAVTVVAAKLKGHSGTLGAACLAVDMFSGRPPIDLAAL